MTAEMPPPWYNVPAFGYQPEHGSYGVPPLILDQSSVSATSVQEGYPEIHVFNGEEFTYTQKLNALRLYTLIWCSNVKAAICMLLGSEPSRGLDSQVNRFLHSRFGARPTNPIYHMVQENVERYDLGVNIRNLARTAMVLRLPIAGGSQEKITSREELANEYRAASFGLRDRAIAAINKGIADPTLEGMRGQVLASRLMGIRTELAADPFDNPDASDKEPLYSELTRNAKQNFWLGRYDENVVAWHWTLRGVVEIRETIKEEPMKTYCKEQFAFVCDAMWRMVISIDVRAHLVQSGSVPARDTDVSVVTDADRAAYWEHIGMFWWYFNYKHKGGGDVQSLSAVKVPMSSFKRANGFIGLVSDQYIEAVEAKLADEMTT
jgi:hypothetical protein